MTTKADFTDEEWTTVLEGPTGAGMLMIAAAKGGMWRETWAMSKAYAEARSQHGASELLDAVVASKPKADHTRYHTPEDLREGSLLHIRAAMALLAAKATADEIAEFRNFVLSLSQKVAAAHREGGVEVSPGEETAMQEIRSALGAGS